MFAEERHQEILIYLIKEGKVIVKDLRVKFDVTEDCIITDEAPAGEIKNILDELNGKVL